MKSLVIGMGNLGFDIAQVFKAECIDAPLQHLRLNPDFQFWRNIGEKIKNDAPDVVFYAMGAGSIAEAEEDPMVSQFILQTVPNYLAQKKQDKTKFIAFSSDYAYAPHLSNYAMIKWHLELSMTRLRNDSFAIRVCNLYGQHKLTRTLPWRLLQAGANGRELKLPDNYIRPTPTDWVAEQLKIHLDEGIIPTEIYPSGSISVYSFAKELGLNVVKGIHDDQRPEITYPLPTTRVSWLELWRSRKQWFGL